MAMDEAAGKWLMLAVCESAAGAASLRLATMRGRRGDGGGSFGLLSAGRTP